jgi:isoleucyl-tRNA synthetase
LHHILQTLTRLIAPVLSFTAEEIWSTMHTGKEDSVFLHEHHALPQFDGAAALGARWAKLRAFRAVALKCIEDQRAAGAIGSSLQAELEFAAADADFELLSSLGDDLRFVMITSRAVVNQVSTSAPVAVTVAPSPHAKCARCWHYRADVGSNAEHAAICGRCVSNLFGEGEKRFYA